MFRDCKSNLMINFVVTIGILSFQANAQTQKQENAFNNQRNAIQLIDEYIEHYRRTGNLEQAVGKLEQAEKLLRNACPVFLNNQDFTNVSLCLIKTGDCLRIRFNWEKAMALYDQALEPAKRGKSSEMEAKALLGKARVFKMGLNDYSRAMTQINAAIPMSEKLENKRPLFDLLELKVQILDETNDLDAAADLINRALKIAVEIEDPRLQIYAYMDRGDIYKNLAVKCDYNQNYDVCHAMADSAEKDYTRMLHLCNTLGYTGLADVANQFLGMLGVRKAMIESGRKYKNTMDQADIYHPQTFSNVLVNKGYLLKDDKDMKDVTQSFLEVVLENVNLRDSTDARSVYILALKHEMEGDYDLALKAYIKAAELLDLDCRKLKDGELRGTFLEDKIEFYYRPIILLLEQGNMEQAFRLLEKSKSRVLTDLIDTKQIKLKDPEAQKVLAEELEIRAGLESAQKEWFRLSKDKAADPTRLDTKRSEIIDLESRYAAFRERAKKYAPEVLEINSSEPVSLKMLQEKLPANTEIIEYLSLESQLLIWHIGKRQVNVKSVFLPRSEITRKVTNLYNTLQTPKSEFNMEPGRELYLYLIRPIKEYIKSDHIVIVPQEALNFIPFQVLFDQETNQFLGESHRISYAPSASLFLKMTGGKLRGKAIIAADPGNPVFVEEAEAVGKLFPSNNRMLLTKTLMGEAFFKQAAEKYNIIHLSVHGEYDFKTPMLSHVKLNPGQNEDGNLTAAEIFGLRLQNVDLIALSACESGRFEATHANELAGINRALLYAGAKASLLSFWKVDAGSTALWMDTFYQTAKSRPFAEAARQALIRVKSKTEYRHPYYWASFYLLGL